MTGLKKYKRLKYLGKGSYGAAILVEMRSNPRQKFVIKEIVIGHLSEVEQTAAKKEAEVLHQMSHSNITMYIESFVESSKLYIVMEHADGGDLSVAIAKRKKTNQRWPENEVMRIFVQICLALKHVHDQNILHRDLKSQNIFLTTNGIIKLGDFGIAKVLENTEEQARTQIGTPYYLSPEICESLPYGRQSDIWSLGVVLFELLTFELPFQAGSLPALVHRICTQELQSFKIHRSYSRSVIDLTENLLNKKPEKRPNLSQIVKTDFMKAQMSKLLSHTLKVGTGGVAIEKSDEFDNLKNDNETSSPSQSPSKLDADELDRGIEDARRRQREQEIATKEDQAREAREAHRQVERKKLRKFREDYRRVNSEKSKPSDIVLVDKHVADRHVDRSKIANIQQEDHYISPVKASPLPSSRFEKFESPIEKEGEPVIQRHDNKPKINPYDSPDANIRQQQFRKSPQSLSQLERQGQIQFRPSPFKDRVDAERGRIERMRAEAQIAKREETDKGHHDIVRQQFFANRAAAAGEFLLLFACICSIFPSLISGGIHYVLFTIFSY